VVLTQVLAHDLTVGYEELENVLLLSINGTPVKNLKHCLELIESCEAEYLRFNFQCNLVLVLRPEDAKKATAEVLAQHGIPAATSPDLQPTPQGASAQANLAASPKSQSRSELQSEAELEGEAEAEVERSRSK